MEINEQRSMAIKLATKFEAPRTLAILKSDQYGDVATVLKTAADEMGLDKLVPLIVNSYPAWAGEALRFLPDLGSHEKDLVDALCTHEAASPSLVSTFAAALPPTSGNVSSLELYLAPGAQMIAQFTMFWLNQGQLYPLAAARNSGQWKWSGDLSVGINRQAIISCVDFAAAAPDRKFPGAPLAPGDVVWMIYRACSTNFDTNFRFIYQPNGGNVQIDVVGGALTPSFSIHQPSQAAVS